MAAERPLSGYCMLGPKGKVVQKTLPCLFQSLLLGAGSGSLACLLQSWLGSGSLACLLESCRGGPLSVVVAGGRVLMTRRLPGNICRLRQSLNSGVAHNVGGRTHFLVAPPSAKVMSDFSGSASTPAPPNSMLAHTCFFCVFGRAPRIPSQH